MTDYTIEIEELTRRIGDGEKRIKFNNRETEFFGIEELIKRRAYLIELQAASPGGRRRTVASFSNGA